MDRSYERGDAGATKERDVGPHSHLTTQKGDRMPMDIQGKAQCQRFRQPLQRATLSERLRTNTWRRLRRDLCPGGKDDDGTVGSGEAASAEEITQCSVVKEEPAYVR